MCGISGILSLNGKPINNLENKIKLMTSLLYHRGPDQEGIFISEDSRCAIGNTRLSIVDIKSKLRQPLKSKSGQLEKLKEIFDNPSDGMSLVNSSKNRFQSLTVTKKMKSPLEVIEIYKKAGQIEGVMIL